MKRIHRFLSLVSLSLMLLVYPSWALAEAQPHEDAMNNVASFLKWNGNIHVKINGQDLPLIPSAYMENSKILIPFKQIFTRLGAQVSEEGNIYKATAGKQIIHAKAGEAKAWLNGKAIELDHTNTKTKDDMLVSLRVIIEGLNANVNWSSTKKTLFITTPQKNTDFTVTSSVLTENKQINEKYVHMAAPDKKDVSLPLSWSHAPKGTKSFAVAIYDFHPIAVNFLHWGVVNIPATATNLQEGASGTVKMPKGSSEVAPYFGPAPPSGSGDHFYKIVVYALDTDNVQIQKKPVYLEDFEKYIEDHVLASTIVTGYYKQ